MVLVRVYLLFTTIIVRGYYFLVDVTLCTHNLLQQVLEDESARVFDKIREVMDGNWMGSRRIGPPLKHPEQELPESHLLTLSTNGSQE